MIVFKRLFEKDVLKENVLEFFKEAKEFEWVLDVDFREVAVSLGRVACYDARDVREVIA